mmetsp:Transcript_3900/g.6826  ORF Transcript_3900/g.6826 Transcript_3900/m.6826 type:complete len:386 (+) Transcript_3900:79-1236(+)
MGDRSKFSVLDEELEDGGQVAVADKKVAVANGAANAKDVVVDAEVKDDGHHGSSTAPKEYSLWDILPSPVLALCAFGIIASLMVYGVLQERIMTKPYGASEDGSEEGEFFRNSVFLVLLNRFAAAIIAAGVLIYQQDEGLGPIAPLYKYFMVSVSNVLATTCQYEALKYVSFPTQTVFKSGKMVPVMIWGRFMDGKKYGLVDYVVGIMVALGCGAFLTFGNVAAKRAAVSDSWIGFVLMAGYLGFDGFTSTFQEKLFTGYGMTIYNQMMYVNLSSSLFSIIMLVSAGRLLSSIEFCVRNPPLLWDASILSVSAVAGQFVISYTVRNFGALAFATIMTVRQLLSIMLSNLLFRHGMTLAQWGAAVVVFGSLVFRSFYKAKYGSGGH